MPTTRRLRILALLLRRADLHSCRVAGRRRRQRSCILGQAGRLRPHIIDHVLLDDIMEGVSVGTPPRTAAGMEDLVARLIALSPTLVAIEATGGFEAVVAAGLAGAGLPVVVVNPAQVRAFAQALGKRAKTDPIDAAVIAHFAEATKPELRQMPDEMTRLLADLVARRRQIVEMIVAEKAPVVARACAVPCSSGPWSRRATIHNSSAFATISSPPESRSALPWSPSPVS